MICAHRRPSAARAAAARRGLRARSAAPTRRRDGQLVDRASRLDAGQRADAAPAPSSIERRVCAGFGYRVPGSLTSIVSTLCGSKPASTLRRASRLRSITAAPISSTTESATSQTISRRRVRTPTAPSLRPPSFSASLRSVRPARSAGSAPARMPVRSDAPSDEEQHARVDARSRRRAAPVREQRGAGGQADAARAAGRRPRPRARAPALRRAAAGTRGARPAPSAARIAISLRRPSARARIRLPTLAQAMSSTSATAASSITSDVRMSPTISSCSGIDGRAPAGVLLRVVALEPLSRSRPSPPSPAPA